MTGGSAAPASCAPTPPTDAAVAARQAAATNPPFGSRSPRVVERCANKSRSDAAELRWVL